MVLSRHQCESSNFSAQSASSSGHSTRARGPHSWLSAQLPTGRPVSVTSVLSGSPMPVASSSGAHLSPLAPAAAGGHVKPAGRPSSHAIQPTFGRAVGLCKSLFSVTTARAMPGKRDLVCPPSAAPRSLAQVVPIRSTSKANQLLAKTLL